MRWIALKMLTGDRAKFYGIVMGLTFAALLITQQGSIFCGLMLRTSAQIMDISGADLWVMDKNVRFIDDVKPMLEMQLYRIRGVEGVKWAVPLYKGNGRAKLTLLDRAAAEKTNDRDAKVPTQEVIEQVIMLGLDDSSMVGAPREIIVGKLSDLRKPDSILVDRVGLRKLFPGQGWENLSPEEWRVLKRDGVYRKEEKVALAARVGDWVKEHVLGQAVRREVRSRTFQLDDIMGHELEMNDHRAVIIGICEATRTFQSTPVVYSTYSRAKQFVPQERKVLSYVLAKADVDPSLPPEEAQRRIKEVARRIEGHIPGLGAKSSPDFQWMTIEYYLKYTGIPINFGITAMLGFLVGTAIAGQTFYNFTLENLKQFGALKAMGATNGRIVGMILLQATVVGLLGYGLGVGLAALFGKRVEGTELAFFTPWWLLPITGVAIVLICILSSILSVRRVIVLEPAVVFRG
jgi:putative ABC transport system permease protein